MSDILIKNMKMPKSCPCELIGVGYDMYCSFAYGVPSRVREYYECCEKETRPDWCPIIGVPPHGRLIDADKLRAEFPHPNDWRNPELAYAHLSGIWATIDCAETIIEAEEET